MIENPNLRKAVASEIKKARIYGAETWGEKSDLNQYLRYLKGLEEFFRYAKTLSSHKILDIGTGKAIALEEMQGSEMGKGLEFEGTVLNKKDIDEEKIKNVKLYRTFAESMSPVPDAAYAGILAVYSVAYSQAPEEAVKNIDKKLVNGGVFKGYFSEQDGGVVGDIRLKSVKLFYKAFKKLGYDVSLKNGVLLAVKSGATIKAEELAKKDLESWESQLIPGA